MCPVRAVPPTSYRIALVANSLQYGGGGRHEPYSCRRSWSGSGSPSGCPAHGIPRPRRRSRSGCGFDRLATTVADLRTAHPDTAIEVWAGDEARLGRKPIARRVWPLQGPRPTTNGPSRFASLYVFGFVHPATGRSRTLILPTANAEAMGQALADFARWADPGG